MDETQMQHGVDWTGQDVSGMIAVEKYRGCRAYWDGQTLWSRGGLEIAIPDTWRNTLPIGVHLDGELYDGPDGERRCATAIRYGRFLPTMQFIIIDCPSAQGAYDARMQHAAQYAKDFIILPALKRIINWTDCLTLLKSIVSRKGEGLMLSRPTRSYRPGRTHSWLKVKPNLVLQHG